MYNNSYEDYIRSVLGYPNNNSQNVFEDYNYSNYDNYDDSQNRNMELEECYPEIYKVVYPVVKKACQNVSRSVTKEEVDRLVDEIYTNVEGNDEIFLNVNITNNIDNKQLMQKEKTEVRTFNGKKIVEEPKREIKVQEKEQKRETRQFNKGLSDIIRILLLRELLGRPNFSGNRPPFGPPPPPFGRPPFGLPPNRPGRPPYFREWDDSLYEY